MRRRGPPLPDPSPHLLLSETDHHTGSGKGVLRHRRGDGVVEGAIQMRYRGVQDDSGDRVGDSGDRHSALAGFGQIQQLALPAHAATAHEPRRLAEGESIVVVLSCHRASGTILRRCASCQTAWRRASARSVASQVKPGRPKCP